MLWLPQANQRATPTKKDYIIEQQILTLNKSFPKPAEVKIQKLAAQPRSATDRFVHLRCNRRIEVGLGRPLCIIGIS